MSKFNKKSLGSKTENLAGGEAFTETPELELVSLLLTSFVSDKFYEGKNTQLKRLEELVKGLRDKKFAGQAAVYARNEFGMRSITQALIGELVNLVKGQPWTKNAVAKSIFRVDDATEMLSYYGDKYGKPFPNSLKKGIRMGMNKFDAYQLSKYKGEGKGVKLVDLLNLVHPKPDAKQRGAFKKLVGGALKATDTWEAKLSEAGKVEAETTEEKEAQVAENKEKAWTDLLKKDKLGYFALLRNLRNILEQAPETIDDVIEKLTDRKAIKKSLIFPFQFKKAYDAVKAVNFDKTRKVVAALDRAVDISVDNCPSFDGKTLIVLDESGSMSGQPWEIGTLFAAVLAKRNPDADIMLFAEDARYISVNPNSLVTDIVSQFVQNPGGTNFNVIFEEARRAYDRIIILSDMQGWMAPNDGFWNTSGRPTRTFDNYKKKFNCKPKVYSFDLQGYGTLQFPEDNVFCITGFSDKTLELMKLLETDRNALVNKIKKVEL